MQETKQTRRFSPERRIERSSAATGGRKPFQGTHGTSGAGGSLGPVFISYRASDGRPLAIELAWALRAAGVPVWHDVSDLPPGDTTQRLREALRSDLSGAILLVTPDLRRSKVVREHELPALLDLERDRHFSFLVANTIKTREKKIDLRAPDRLLTQPAGTLSRLKQYPLLTRSHVWAIAKEVAVQRMSQHRALDRSTLLIDIQTRLHPRSNAVNAGLVVRTRPPEPGRRVPPESIWAPLQSFLTVLPQLIEVAGAKAIRVRGGAHLSVAFSLGAALPTALGWPVEVEDRNHETWTPSSNSKPAKLSEHARELGAIASPVAVMVDIVPDPSPTDTFGEHVVAENQYSASLRLSPARRRPLSPAVGVATAADVAQRIRRFASEHNTNEVHLFLRTPFAVSVLLGRALNTLKVHLHEWEDINSRPRYIHTVVVASGHGGGPIIGIPRRR